MNKYALWIAGYRHWAFLKLDYIQVNGVGVTYGYKQYYDNQTLEWLKYDETEAEAETSNNIRKLYETEEEMQIDLVILTKMERYIVSLENILRYTRESCLRDIIEENFVSGNIVDAGEKFGIGIAEELKIFTTKIKMLIGEEDDDS